MIEIHKSISRLASVLILFFLFSHSISAQSTASPDAKQSQPDNYLNEIVKNGILRWTVNTMPLAIFIKPGDTADGYRPIFTTLLQEAFSEWAACSGGRISFGLTNDISKAQIICGWTSDKNDMTKLTEGGHALVMPDGHNIKQVQITILTKTTAGGTLSDPFCKRVALHEVGHTLGLIDHSPNQDDMMFGAPLPTSTNCTLSARDRNTLIALYDIPQAKVDQSTLNVANMLPAQNNQSKLARVIRLNAEASQAMQSKNLSVAVAKLEEAHKISPDDNLISTNLGAAYGNCAMVACLLKDNQRAEIYFKHALPLLAKSSNRENYLLVLKCYQNYLRMNNRSQEAEKVATQITTLSAKH